MRRSGRLCEDILYCVIKRSSAVLMAELSFKHVFKPC